MVEAVNLRRCLGVARLKEVLGFVFFLVCLKQGKLVKIVEIEIRREVIGTIQI